MGKRSPHRGASSHLVNEVERDVAQQFQKKFHFRPTDDGGGDGAVKPPELPPLESVFSIRPAYRVESLQKVKAALNKVKNRLNDFEISDWHQHTRRRSSLQPVLSGLKHRIGGEFVTQAFAKLYECVAGYELVPPPSESREFYSVHLCEAPGAFITGLNHYLKLNREMVQWRWFANTLNPYYEGNCLGNMIVDDRFILHTLDSWCFGEDYTGDVMRKENMGEIVRRSKEFPMINLVTADGSIDCLDVPEAQEEHVSKLHLAEALTALKILTQGGCFILKMFTLFEHSSVDLLYLLYVCFRELHVFKPATSKPGNSEVYVIAKYFRKPVGLDEYLDRLFDGLNSDCSMFDLQHIPESFVKEVRDCAELFMMYQQDVIEHNIHFYQHEDLHEEVRLRIFKETMCKMFFDKYKIKPIRRSDAILNGVDVASGSPNINPRDNYGTYNERSMLSSISGDTRLGMLRDRLNDFYDSMISFMPRSRLTDRPFASSRSCVEIIQLCCGKSILKLLSSKFIVITYVRFLSEVIDIVTSLMPTAEEQPTLLTLNRSTYTLTIDVKAYATLYSYDIFEKELFHHLLQCIIDLPLQEGIDHLVVENWLLLTQFCVGLVFFLKTYVFEHIESTNGNQLRFSRLKADGIDSLRYLNETIQMEQNACAEGKSVLGIVPTQVLFDGSFYYAVINYNNRLCLDYCTVLLDAGK
ncbi:cap-specific mRNA (nucleoside-2'-O-)-methyltransferase 2 [Ochlerotatus camptorhynchus]|uniref:cap-specific mRNA (nucleoside-2'-O-)-methyltransferase 2 n=1 Tax=Ochlerotatus camptorhynchus TaxID=644619 RepID=UPI0031DD34C8